MHLQLYGQLTFNTAGKNIQWKRRYLQQRVLRKLNSDMHNNETEKPTYTTNKNNSKWMKDINVRQEVIKILKEDTGSNCFDVGHRNFLIDMCLGKINKSRE